MASGQVGMAPGVQGGGTSDSGKTRIACVNCRRQKMKCQIEQGSSCKRCYRAGIPCVFKARANAAAHYSTETLGYDNSTTSPSSSSNRSILERLNAIESVLGLNNREPHSIPASQTPISATAEQCNGEDDQLRTLWDSVAVLKRINSTTSNSRIWSWPLIKKLWFSFHNSMPGLHFLPNTQSFESPNPLLLASMLYTSSVRGSEEVAHLAPDYFRVVCYAIAHVSMPDIPGMEAGPNDDPEKWAFQTVLGIVLAGLISEASTSVTGIWVSVGYRLILEHSPSQMDDASQAWKKLFSGLQIVDLEHASLHLSCPVIPIEAPLPKLHVSPRDQLYSLSRMMHTGLTHFTGRGIATIWSCFSDEEYESSAMSSFTPVDSAVIRDWARQLDDWLTQFTSGSTPSEQNQRLVFRQYILHRLLVLSIYLPSRGLDLFSPNTTANERLELLVSARAAVRMHINDRSIWSNFDLVMITWAALIVLQGVKANVGEPDEDLSNVKNHLALLRSTHEPDPSLRRKIARRLEANLEGATMLRTYDQGMTLEETGQDLEFPYSIFDQSILQSNVYHRFSPGGSRD